MWLVDIALESTFINFFILDAAPQLYIPLHLHQQCNKLDILVYNSMQIVPPVIIIIQNYWKFRERFLPHKLPISEIEILCFGKIWSSQFQRQTT